MSTHNIGFYEDLTKIIFEYHQIRTLFLLLMCTWKSYIFLSLLFRICHFEIYRSLIFSVPDIICHSLYASMYTENS